VNHDSPTDIRHALEAAGIALKKRWGQNFMINRGARRKIVELLDPQPGESIWEIGAGLGALTEMIAPLAGNTVVFESDHGLVRHLQSELSDSRVQIVAGDFLDTREQALAAYGAPKRIGGNLPYSSGAAIVAALLEHGPQVDRMVFTLQKEVVERMCAPPGSRTYSSFSAICQAFYGVAHRGDLQPGSFFPAPEVQSGVVIMDLRADADRVRDRAVFFALVRSAFAARRKTLRNNLLRESPFPVSKRDLLAVLQRMGVEAGVRAEALGADEMVAVSNQIAALVHRGASEA
jgi:16S rRNA (adenine1518-N6/adenine1519-N6)-dimethyltransferase